MDYAELLRLAEQKEIPYTKKQLEKMTEEKLEEVWEEYKRKELDEFNESMTDIVIFKLDEAMKKYKWIKEDSELGKKLQNKKLFRNDLKFCISCVSPYLPMIGFLEGAVTIGQEMFESYINKNATPTCPEESDPESEESETQS